MDEKYNRYESLLIIVNRYDPLLIILAHWMYIKAAGKGRKSPFRAHFMKDWEVLTHDSMEDIF